ncbi:MAG: NAD-dependent epimerase/dehydratase family protein [Flavobacteriales bacterium]
MILVTGATGLLGSHLLIQLTEKGDSCRALYRDKTKIPLVKALFDYYLKAKAEEQWKLVEWVPCDLLNLSELEEAIQGADYVYHCAALVSFFKADFESCIKNNRIATANVVNFALKYPVKKLCYVSSTAAIGTNSKGLSTEKNKWEPGSEVSGYSVSKFLAEKEVWRGIEEGLNAVIINPCVIFGPGDWNNSSLEIFKAAKKGMPFYPPGSNAIVDARDVSNAMILLMDSSIQKERFLCTGPNLRFYDLFSRLSIKLGKTKPRFSSPKYIALFYALINELLGHVTGKRSGVSIESVHSGYKNISYDRSKLEQAISISFHSLDETIDNVINGSTFIVKTTK